MRSKGLTVSALTVVVLFVLTMAAPSWAASIPCTGPVGAVEINGNISAGAGCDLSGASVNGNVTVNPGGSLRTKAESTTVITGDVQSNEAEQVRLAGATTVEGSVRLRGTRGEEGGFGNFVAEGTVKGNIEIEGGLAFANVERETVGGNVQIFNTSGGIGRLEVGGVVQGQVTVRKSTVRGNVEVGNNSLTGIGFNRLEVERTSVAGNLQLYNNSSTGALLREYELRVQGNHVSGNAELVNNAFIRGRGLGAVTIVTENVVTNNLNCEGNKPPPQNPSETPNTAKHKLGQCALL